jgi:cytochrome c oxidase subunit 3
MQNTAETVREKPVDYTGSKMGMWIFLFTEFLFFGGLFLLYAVYRSQYTQGFHTAANELDRVIGSVNTVILITSSLTMALSVSAMKRANSRLSGLFQFCTILLGVAFLVAKYFEWSDKIGHGIFPGAPDMLIMEQGAILFYSLYFVMTGLHGLHVLAGIIVLARMLFLSTRSEIHERDFIKLENAGLYWHFVDIVWIYLFPLLYLIT